MFNLLLYLWHQFLLPVLVHPLWTYTITGECGKGICVYSAWTEGMMDLEGSLSIPQLLAVGTFHIFSLNFLEIAILMI